MDNKLIINIETKHKNLLKECAKKNTLSLASFCRMVLVKQAEKTLNKKY